MLRQIAPTPDRLQTENLALSLKQYGVGGEPQPPAALSELSVWELSNFNLLRYIENSTPLHYSKRLQTDRALNSKPQAREWREGLTHLIRKEYLGFGLPSITEYPKTEHQARDGRGDSAYFVHL